MWRIFASFIHRQRLHWQNPRPKLFFLCFDLVSKEQAKTTWDFSHVTGNC